MTKDKKTPAEAEDRPETPPEPVDEPKSGTETPPAADAENPGEPANAWDAAPANAEMAELQAKYLYLQAEYQNYRKRMAKELSDARRFAIEETVFPFLTVFDFLAMAETAADQSDNVESIRQGLKMIIGEYRKAFDELGLRPFAATGEKFDPSLHEAVAHEPSAEIPEGVVSKQWNCGFKLGDRLLRPARVVVSSGAPDAAPAAEKE